MEILGGRSRMESYFAPGGAAAGLDWADRYPWQLLDYRRGEYLCRYQEPVPRLLLLLEGVVMVSITTPQGRTHLVTFCRPGELICGDVEVMLGNAGATADLRVHGESARCAGLEIARHREALLSDLDFLRCTARRLAREMVKDSIYATNNLLLRVENRLAAYLLDTATEGLFRENLTRTAELLGVSYRQLSRVMRSFLDRGWVEKTAKGWRLTNQAALKKLSGDILSPDTESRTRPVLF